MKDKTSLALAGLLIASGLVHLVLWLGSGQLWEGGVSLRKPALFGISGGLTVWSLAWVISCLPPRRYDAWLSQSMSWALLVEVSLITVQYWRGVPSHFNHATTFDGTVERTMLLLILLATGGIAWVCLRAFQTIERPPTLVLAIRAGMLLLFVSCLLGIGTTVLGQWNMTRALPYGTWGKAGVLKFPHGIALHAIQLLPLCAWLFEKCRFPYSYIAMQGLVVSQAWAILFAVWQTWQGRARFDMDVVGAILLAFSVASVSVPLLWNAWAARFHRPNALRIN